MIYDLVLYCDKLNAQVIKNLQRHFRPREREGEWSRNIRTGPACKAGDHTRADPKTA